MSNSLKVLYHHRDPKAQPLSSHFHTNARGSRICHADPTTTWSIVSRDLQQDSEQSRAKSLWRNLRASTATFNWGHHRLLFLCRPDPHRVYDHIMIFMAILCVLAATNTARPSGVQCFCSVQVFYIMFLKLCEIHSPSWKASVTLHQALLTQTGFQ